MINANKKHLLNTITLINVNKKVTIAEIYVNTDKKV